jgi:hypothetical protein
MLKGLAAGNAFDSIGTVHPLTRMRMRGAFSFNSCPSHRRCEVYMRIAVIVVLFIALGVAPVVESTAASLATDWYGTTRCPPVSSSPSSPATTSCGHYERCKVTHRCARGEEGTSDGTRQGDCLHYTNAAFASQTTRSGQRHFRASLDGSVGVNGLRSLWRTTLKTGRRARTAGVFPDRMRMTELSLPEMARHS